MWIKHSLLLYTHPMHVYEYYHPSACHWQSNLSNYKPPVTNLALSHLYWTSVVFHAEACSHQTNVSSLYKGLTVWQYEVLQIHYKWLWCFYWRHSQKWIVLFSTTVKLEAQSVNDMDKTLLITCAVGYFYQNAWFLE